MAPSSAVKPAPTWAAKATPAMSGVTSRVLANAPIRPVKVSAPICWRPLKPWMPDLGAGEERHREDHEDHAAADDEGAGADRDVRHEVEHDVAVLQPQDDLRDDLVEDLRVELELLADVLEEVAGAPGDGPQRADGAGEAGHQNFCGTSAK